MHRSLSIPSIPNSVCSMLTNPLANLYRICLQSYVDYNNQQQTCDTKFCLNHLNIYQKFFHFRSLFKNLVLEIVIRAFSLF
ncbi:Uncharacterized protein APZ42_001359 [Daphnia magna]|uniref:Uncharacterized protein n=1 Tax=Daphnia magna TaxID=35525 RepID=A0A164J1F1_9CRUS|nr:Uncharacterized protein APZ42_001359 [Daphnia magna]